MIGGNDVATCAKTWFFGWNPGSGVIFLDFLPTPHNTLQQQAKDLAEADRAALVDKYSIRAVALLKEDRSLGYFKDPTKVAHMKKDTNLDPLRERDDFKQLIKSFEADEQE